MKHILFSFFQDHFLVQTQGSLSSCTQRYKLHDDDMKTQDSTANDNIYAQQIDHFNFSEKVRLQLAGYNLYICLSNNLSFRFWNYKKISKDKHDQNIHTFKSGNTLYPNTKHYIQQDTNLHTHPSHIWTINGKYQDVGNFLNLKEGP